MHRFLAATLIAANLVMAGCQTAHMESRRVTIPTADKGEIRGLVYGKGGRGVVLAHGGQFNKESWYDQALILANARFKVLAFDFRGFGESKFESTANRQEAHRLDVLAAIGFLRNEGATDVAVLGASMGGDAAAALAASDPVAIDRLVLLAAGAYTALSNYTRPKLFIMSADDIIGENTPRIDRIRRSYEQASEPKRFVTLRGSAHAQHLFNTDQRDLLMSEILQFLLEKRR